jgi:hypothetical protein
MSEADPANYTEPPIRYEVVLSRPVTEVVFVEGDEATTVEAAQELAYQRAEGSLCHQCAAHFSLGDNTHDYVTEVYAAEDLGPGQTHEIIHDYEAEDLDARLKAVRNSTLDEVAGALALLSTGQPSGEVRKILREAAVKIRGAKMGGGKVDLL